MGNKCSINAKIARNCWFSTISHTLWWAKWPNMLSYHHHKKERDGGAPPPPKAIEQVQITPPQPAKMEEGESKATTITAAQPPPLKPIITSKEEVKKKEESSSSLPPPSTAGDNPKKPLVFKRAMSAGLQVDSVLRTKTGQLKEHFELGRKLGHGQFGTTFLCTEKETGKEYACKSIAKRKLLTQEDVDDVRREVEILHHLSGNPNVVSIKGAYEDAVAVHVVMEVCEGGELFDRILKRGHYSEKKAAELTRTIVGVIETCHSLGVMHRDLKPENFLFVNEDEDSPLKAIDFGLSMFFKPGDCLCIFLHKSYVFFLLF